MPRTAHYVASTHWDREWYESFQGFRMRLVSLLDELFLTFEQNPEYRSFVMDGQVIPVLDYLEIRPGMRERVIEAVKAGKLKLGPWYVLPDEWLVSGESLVRNLQFGMKLAGEFGAPSSRAGFACDMFGHTGQLPQVFDQLGIPCAFVWRGTHEREHYGLLRWAAPDGTVIPSYRFGPDGYCTYAFRVRRAMEADVRLDLDDAVCRLADYTLFEAGRTPEGPILLFDGGDHLEIEPRTPEMIARANERLAERGIEIVHSDLDRYMEDVLCSNPGIQVLLSGELRETGRDPVGEDQQWLIPGVLSSRIHLKLKNAACEDELCLWAEPFSAFAAMELGREYPDGYFRTAWKHLLENHPHDSICGCSIDQVHQDMVYRYDQSFGISSRLSAQALSEIACAAAPGERPRGELVLGVFNQTARDIDEPVDLDIPLPPDWPSFQEFFGFEKKYSFHLHGATGEEIPYQLIGQEINRSGFRRLRYKFPVPDDRPVVRVTAPLRIPAFGYAVLLVEPAEGPVRYHGSLAVSGRAVGNEFFRVEAAPNGTLTLTDQRSGRTYTDLLTFEDRADIGDGWYHGVAVNDRIHTSASCGADVALVADGPEKATLRIRTVMTVPEEFDFGRMVRSERLIPLVITSDVTIRRGCPRVEVETTVENTVRDHRLRVLFPTGLTGDTYLSDAAFDVVERPLALAADNASRRELDVETRPQQTWTAFGDGENGLAVVSRGLPESAVLDRPDRSIALTLLRGFRRAVFSGDNPGGQVLGTHVFRYWVTPYRGAAPAVDLCHLGQRVNDPVRTAMPERCRLTGPGENARLPREHSFLEVDGPVVATSVQLSEDRLIMRMFNPATEPAEAAVRPGRKFASARCVTLNGSPDPSVGLEYRNGTARLRLPGKRIATVEFGA